MLISACNPMLCPIHGATPIPHPHSPLRPRLSKFADLTDGACTEAQILFKEMELLQTLTWNLSPVTPVAWLEVRETEQQ